MEATPMDRGYRDYSRYLIEGGTIPHRRRQASNFPSKLHRLLSEPQFSDIVCWMPHGRAWKILDKEKLMSEAVPRYFGQTKYSSFNRQLNCWGFKKFYGPGPSFGTYFHECFLQGMPELTKLMVRCGKDALPHIQEEPNFDLISRMYPLPPPPVIYPTYVRSAPVSPAGVASMSPECASDTFGSSTQNDVDTWKGVPVCQLTSEQDSVASSSDSIAASSSEKAYCRSKAMNALRARMQAVEKTLGQPTDTEVNSHGVPQDIFHRHDSAGSSYSTTSRASTLTTSMMHLVDAPPSPVESGHVGLGSIQDQGESVSSSDTNHKGNQKQQDSEAKEDEDSYSAEDMNRFLEFLLS